MEIHRYEAAWIGVSLLLIVGWIATVTYGAVGVGITMVGDEAQIEEPSDPAASEDFREPGVYQTGPDEYAVYVVARQFLFEPGTSEAITVPAGSTVTLYVTSADVIHGFQLVGTNVNAMVIPGQVTKMTVEFEEPGTYGILCNEYCGAAHHAMEGRLEVVPPEEYDGGSA